MPRSVTTFCLLLTAQLVGCSSATQTHEPGAPPVLQFQAERYRAMFDASVHCLRDQNFEIERSDYRFGVITTKPREAATIFEFWIDDATTPDQRRSDTLNAQQRIVKVQVRPIETKPPYETFRLTAEVIVERVQRPERYLTHSATGRLTAAYAATPAHLAERGITGPYTQTLTRDPYLEARLVRAIGRRAEKAP